MPPLSGTELAKQKDIFEAVLVREILAEIQFLWDISAERRERRKEFGDKLLKLITDGLTAALGIVGAAVPVAAAGTSIASSVVTIAGVAVQYELDKSHEKENEKASDFFSSQNMAVLKLYLRQFAKVASLRYEYLIAAKLSRDPGKSVIPLAQIGARRVVEYLKRLTQSGNDAAKLHKEGTPLIKTLLNGLIRGHSGKGKDGISNHELESQDGTKDLTVEGALSRIAMRSVVTGELTQAVSASSIYYRKKALHIQQDIDTWYEWGQTHLVDDKDLSAGPKYGFMYVDEETRAEYGYAESFPGLVADRHKYYPSVYIASKNDVLAYLSHIQAEKDPKKRLSFQEYLQKKVGSAAVINEVWVRGADFSKMTLEGCNFTKVDFSGCMFVGTTLRNCNFHQAIMMFINAQDLVCESGDYNQVNFGSANLKNATFTGTSQAGANWVLANTTGLKVQESVASEIGKQKQAHAEQMVAMRNQNKENFKVLAQQLNGQVKSTQSQRQEFEEDVKPAKDSNPEGVKLLVQSMNDLLDQKFNNIAYKAYYQQRIQTLQSELTKANTEEKKIITGEIEYLNSLISDLDKYNGEIEKSLDAIRNTMKAEAASLQKKHFKVVGFENVTLAPGAQIKGRGIFGYLYSVKSQQLTDDVKKLINDLSEKALQYQYEVRGLKDVTLEKKAVLDYGRIEGGGVLTVIGEEEQKGTDEKREKKHKHKHKDKKDKKDKDKSPTRTAPKATFLPPPLPLGDSDISLINEVKAAIRIKYEKQPNQVSTLIKQIEDSFEKPQTALSSEQVEALNKWKNQLGVVTSAPVITSVTK